jgi:predicted permease
MRRERRAVTSRRTMPMESVRRDLSSAARGLGREPGFTAFVCVTLALGLGANAAMFGIADRLLFAGPAHITDASRVVRVYATEQPEGMRAFTTDTFGHVTYDALQRGGALFDGVATYSLSDGVLGTAPEARPIRIGHASASLLSLLGVRPVSGRFFTADEDAPHGPVPVAVVNEAIANAWLGGAETAIGRTLIVSDESFTVIGVVPRAFTGPQFGPVDVWIPASLLGPRITRDWESSWTAQWLQIVVRLKAGVTAEQAAAEATAVHRRAYTGGQPSTTQARFSVAPLRADAAGSDATEVRVVQWLTGVAAIVLLIACANVANLLLARGLRRTREVAVRAALGASRWRIVRLLLLESLLLAAGGGAAGLIVAHGVGTLARRVLFPSIDWASSPVNGRVLVVSLLLSLATGVLVGVIPALRATRPQLGEALKTGVREGGGHRSPLRSTLTVLQAALSVVLLVGAGLFVRSLWNVRSLDLGFDPEQVISVEVTRQTLSRIPDGPARVAERARRRNFFVDVLDRVRRIPGVDQAAVAHGTPFGNRFSLQLRTPGVARVPTLSTGGPSLSAVTPSYFETMGTRIVGGRGFHPGDGAGTPPIAIVSETMAQTLWPAGDAIGKCLLIGKAAQACAEIVGIAENTRRGRLREAPVMHYYIPAGQEADLGFGGAELLVRTSDRSGAVASELRRVLLEADRSATYVTIDTIQRRRLDPQTRPWMVGATVFALSGLLALVVAATGIYSVMSYLIADRRHEIGVRLALGARASDIVRLVLRGSLLMATAGVLLGEIVAAMLGRLIEPLLFELSPRDPGVFGGVAAVIVVVAVAASLIPARRARAVPAVEALRQV